MQAKYDPGQKDILMTTSVGNFFGRRVMTWNSHRGTVIKDWGMVGELALPAILSIGFCEKSTVKGTHVTCGNRTVTQVPVHCEGSSRCRCPEKDLVQVTQQGVPPMKLHLNRRGDGRNAQLQYAAFSPDGTRIVTISKHAHCKKDIYSLRVPRNDPPYWLITLWDANTGDAIYYRWYHLKPHWVTADVFFSADGNHVARVTRKEGDYEGKDYIWRRIKNEQYVVTLSDARTLKRAALDAVSIGIAEFGRLLGVAVSRDGGLVGTGFDDGTTVIWNASTGARVATLNAPGMTRVESVAFDPYRQRVAIAGLVPPFYGQVCVFWGR